DIAENIFGCGSILLPANKLRQAQTAGARAVHRSEVPRRYTSHSASTKSKTISKSHGIIDCSADVFSTFAVPAEKFCPAATDFSSFPNCTMKFFVSPSLAALYTPGSLGALKLF